MIKKMTSLFKLYRLHVVAAFMLSGINFAQTTSKNPIYNGNQNEAIEKRDAFSKHFQNPDGSFTVAIASGPIHYEKAGVFTNIDNSIQPFSSSTYAYANVENVMESYFGTTAHAGLKNKTKEGEVLEFRNTTMYWEVNGEKVNEQQSANVSLTTIDNKAYYNNLFGSINAEFVVQNGKRKLNYIIPNAAALSNAPTQAAYLVFTEQVIIPENWSYANTSNGVTIYDDKQKQI